MTATLGDRPQPRRRARPAADDAVDPIDLAPPPGEPVQPPAAAEAPTVHRSKPASPFAELPPRGHSQAFVTLNVRIAPEVDALVRQAMDGSGASKRAVVEYALRHTYG